jgi:hypothetical protein
MPIQTIGTTLNIGYPGSFSRNADCIIANRVIKNTDAAGPAFGDPVILNADNSYSKFGAAHTAAQFVGVAVREVKQATDYMNQGDVVYRPGEPADVLKRGDVCVKVNNGIPTAGGTLYIRIAANATIPAGVIGGFEAVADGANTIALTNAAFSTGNMDSNNVAEITILTRKA